METKQFICPNCYRTVNVSIEQLQNFLTANGREATTVFCNMFCRKAYEEGIPFVPVKEEEEEETNEVINNTDFTKTIEKARKKGEIRYFKKGEVVRLSDLW